jgi:hypothetical protein
MDNTMNENQRVEDVETALKAIGRKISSDEFLVTNRSAIDEGLDITYTITIKQQNSGIFCGLNAVQKEPKKIIISLCNLK